MPFTLRLASASFILCLFAGFAFAAQPIGVERLHATIDAINQGSPDALARYAAEHLRPAGEGGRSLEERLATFGRIATLTGGLELHKVESVSETKVSGIARQKRDGVWVRLSLDLEPQAPHRITQFSLVLIDPPADADAAPMDAKGLANALRTHIDGFARADRFSGSVLVARGNQVLVEGAWGEADKRFGVANKVDTKINLGSMNKMFTAVAIAQLVERGKITFADRLIEVLPEYRNREVAEKVTLHHLLTHTSGMGSYWEPLFARNWAAVRSHEEIVALTVDEPLSFTPGERFAYSNSGFAVLGLVIEKVSGMSYFDYVRRNIFEPAGMLSTDSYESDAVVPNLATGYTRSAVGDKNHEPAPDAPWRSNLFQHSAKGCAAGGGYSTVGDLHRFAQALTQGKLVSAATLKTLVAPKIAMGPDNEIHYAYGFGIHGEGATRSFGHGGGGPGISAELAIYPETGDVVVVLSNYDQAARPVSSKAKELLMRLR